MIILDETQRDLIIPSNIGNLEGYHKGYEDGYNAGLKAGDADLEQTILNKNNN